MKQCIFILLLLSCFIAGAQQKQLDYASFGNSTYTPQYVGSTYDEIRERQKRLTQLYDQNRNYKDQLQNWVYKIRSNKTDEKLVKELNFVQGILDFMEKEGRFETYEIDLRKVENDIRKAMSEFDSRLNIQAISIEEKQQANASSFSKFSGLVDVFSYTPIYQFPNTNSVVLLQVLDKPVQIIKFVASGFYLVECNGIKGYLTASMIKGPHN